MVWTLFPIYEAMAIPLCTTRFYSIIHGKPSKIHWRVQRANENTLLVHCNDGCILAEVRSTESRWHDFSGG